MVDLNEVANVITAITALVAALAGAYVTIKGKQKLDSIETKADSIEVKADETHKQLNSNLEAHLAYQQDLRDALQASGVRIPPDKSLARPEDE